MKLRIAFAGFRHGHILDLYRLAGGRDDVEVAAAAEEHDPTRRELAAGGTVEITHTSYDRMWEEVDFDILAVGDYYGRRGELLIRALAAGRHVIADKPICTKLEELERIAELSSAGPLCVGCQLSMRDMGNFRGLRDAVRAGRIGEVHTIDFQGQHPLLRGRRPEWYFEPGKHGGTINDLAIHAMDIIPWMTGRRIVEVVAARAWNARAGDPEWFQDGAQIMLRLDNGGGVLGDVSYLTPERFAYKVPCYWRFTLHGSTGLAETSAVAEGVDVYGGDGDDPVHLPPAEKRAGGYFEDFLAEVRGRAAGDDLNTQQVLTSSRVALLTQKAADQGLRDIACD